MTYYSTKTYEHFGSAAFRQWRADSHCRFLHGYSPTIRLEFGSNELDVRNWVVDFGSLKGFKTWLENTFDHKTLVSEDDPEMTWFKEAKFRRIIDLVIVPANGCERYAELIYEAAEIWLSDNGYSPRVWVESVEFCEHGGNSAIFRRPKNCGCNCNGCKPTPIQLPTYNRHATDDPPEDHQGHYPEPEQGF